MAECAPFGDEDNVDIVARSLQGGRRLIIRIIPDAVKCPGCGFSGCLVIEPEERIWQKWRGAQRAH